MKNMPLRGVWPVAARAGIGVLRSIGQEPNPDRRVNQDDHAVVSE